MPVSLLQAIYVPADDLTDPAPATTFAHLDATTVLSRSIAELGIYPAVDPLDSTSRMLDVRIIGEEHYNVARGVQRVLQVGLQFTPSSPAVEPGLVTVRSGAVLAQQRDALEEWMVVLWHAILDGCVAGCACFESVHTQPCAPFVNVVGSVWELLSLAVGSLALR